MGYTIKDSHGNTIEISTYGPPQKKYYERNREKKRREMRERYARLQTKKRRDIKKCREVTA